VPVLEGNTVVHVCVYVCVVFFLCGPFICFEIWLGSCQRDHDSSSSLKCLEFIEEIISFQGVGLLCCMSMFRNIVQFHSNYIAGEGNRFNGTPVVCLKVSNVN
jgi:hypothetical protein